jgi:LuxR family maltose regulon positive regulatory protein
VPELHRRAARWYADAAVPDQAIEHAHRSGDVAQFTQLVLDWSQQTWAAGGIESVHRWMSWLEEANDASAFPAIAAHAALIFALVGEPARAERWSAIAKGATGSGALPDGSTVEGTLAYLDAIEARQGVEQMRLDARRAWEGLSPASPLRTTMVHTEALADLLDGALERADDRFVEAQEAAELARIGPLVAMVLCERASIAVERGDWPSAVDLVRRATSIVVDGGYETYWSSALVLAWAARVAVHLGLRADAVEHTRRALALRPLLTHALPVVSAQALLATAQASLGLGDHHAAAATARQAEEIVRRRPGLGDLPGRVAALLVLVQDAANRGRPDTLTPAEVRLLPLLATHLTFPLIAERLGVSRNTVKTQAISTYRKLGVSSRSEAVARWETLDGS